MALTPQAGLPPGKLCIGLCSTGFTNQSWIILSQSKSRAYINIATEKRPNVGENYIILYRCLYRPIAY